MLGGVHRFVHEPEGKDDRMMEILFMKREVKVFVNAVIEELSERYILGQWCKILLNACHKNR